LLLEPGSQPLPGFIARDALRKFAGQQWVIDRGMDSMLTGRDLVDSRLGGFQEPLLIVWGADDQLIPLGVAEQMHSLDPRSELDVVQGCGHLAPSLCSSRVAAATAAFLQANPAPSGGLRTFAAQPRLAIRCRVRVPTRRRQPVENPCGKVRGGRRLRAMSSMVCG
jgi:hypothetical protein